MVTILPGESYSQAWDLRADCEPGDASCILPVAPGEYLVQWFYTPADSPTRFVTAESSIGVLPAML